MQEKQQIGIDFPSKVLIWEDEEDNVWLTRNQTSGLTQRHSMSESQAGLNLEKKINKLYKVVEK